MVFELNTSEFVWPVFSSVKVKAQKLLLGFKGF
jgi:hypothetical protein